MTTLACHQPEFLPYLGFWNKMSKADKFVILDDVQFERQGVQNRNLIIGDKWITVPIVRKFPQKICDAKIDNTTTWHCSIWGKLIQLYKDGPEFGKHEDFFSGVFNRKWESLLNLNVSLIAYIAGELMDHKIESRLSSVFNLKETSSMRIVRLCEEMGCDKYLSGPGGKNYLKEDMFRKRGIEILYTDYQAPDNLSIVHHLFTRSIDEIRRMIE